MIRQATAWLCALLWTIPAAYGSELTLGASTIQKLVAQQLFNRQGRWYLLDNGPCYAYLEHPRTRLTGGRLLLDAHLSARVGVDMGGNCLGSGFASNVTLSGRLIGKASTVTLDDIRVDHAADSATAEVIDLIRQTAPQALPQVLSVDVLAAVRGTPIDAAGIPVSVTRFRIVDVATHTDAVIVQFDLSLSAP